MKNCDTVRDDLKAYGDGELPLLRRLAVLRHLARCAACRQELAVLRGIGNELRAAEAVPGERTRDLPPALRARILSGVEGIAPGSDLAARPPSRRPPLPVWGAWAAAALAVLALTPLILPRFSGTRQEIANAPRSAASSRSRNDVAAKAAPVSPPPPSVVAEADRSLFAKPSATASGASSPPGAALSKDGDAMKTVRASPRPASPSPRRRAEMMRPLAVAKAAPAQEAITGRGYPGSPAKSSELLRESVAERADLQVQVAELDAGNAAVREIVRGAGGVVLEYLDLTIQGEAKDTDGRRIVLTLQIPAAQFETIRSRIAGLEKERGFSLADKMSPPLGVPMNNAPATSAGALGAAPPPAPAAAPSAKQEEARGVRFRYDPVRARQEIREKRPALRTITVELRETAPDAPRK